MCCLEQRILTSPRPLSEPQGFALASRTESRTNGPALPSDDRLCVQAAMQHASHKPQRRSFRKHRRRSVLDCSDFLARIR
ncbi:hypothetical protein PSP6_510056 [Paraburkholderia tropica]|nr:hypothetical protein PSP6_510056 [Paraburkholderia tropica]